MTDPVEDLGYTPGRDARDIVVILAVLVFLVVCVVRSCAAQAPPKSPHMLSFDEAFVHPTVSLCEDPSGRLIDCAQPKPPPRTWIPR